MKPINFNAVKDHVSTQYGDLSGLIEIDGHSSISSFYDLCKDHGFDTTDLLIVGISIYESGIGRKEGCNVSILYLNKSEYGNTFDEIKFKIAGLSSLTLKKKSIFVKYSEFGKYIKRCDLLVVSNIIEYVNKIEIEEDED